MSKRLSSPIQFWSMLMLSCIVIPYSFDALFVVFGTGCLLHLVFGSQIRWIGDSKEAEEGKVRARARAVAVSDSDLRRAGPRPFDECAEPILPNEKDLSWNCKVQQVVHRMKQLWSVEMRSCSGNLSGFRQAARRQHPGYGLPLPRELQRGIWAVQLQKVPVRLRDVTSDVSHWFSQAKFQWTWVVHECWSLYSEQ